MLIGVYDNADQVSGEIEEVAGLLTDAVEKILPCTQPRKKSRWRDDTLSRAARVAWKEAGCRTGGPLFEEKGRLRRTIRKRVRFCAAQSERLRIQWRNQMFAAGDSRRFKTPQRRKSRCAKLVVEGEEVQDPETLLKVWMERFARSRLETTPDLSALKRKVELMES